ncbi:protein hinderin [Aplochiton taeniatus]
MLHTVLSCGPAKGKELRQSSPADVLQAPFPTIQNPLSNAQENQVMPGTSQAKSMASLKDLCPEDKRRIANLIQELARANEEKEESVQRLRDEQESFECKIQQLEHQNLLIVQEREGLQQQYRECQELLGLYQQYLSQQQEKLNHSIAQLSQEQDHRKQSGSEGAPTRPSTSRPNGSALDGSYLGLPTARATRPPEDPDMLSGSSSSTPPPVHSPRERALSPATSPNKLPGCGKGGRSDPWPKCHHKREQQVQGSRTEPRATGLGSRLGANPHRGLEEQRTRLLPSVGALGPGVEGPFAARLLGPGDWEEMRRGLLLQKMQLETERERLHARLAQQEERLLRQNQQLRQSRLDYSRFQQETAAELGNFTSRNRTTQVVEDSPHHGQALRSDQSHDLTDPADQLNLELAAQRVSTPLRSTPNGVHVHEILNQSRKDMATSPLVSQAFLKKQPQVPVMPTAFSRSPQARLDSSVIELLDCFSPVSLPERCRTTLRTPRSAYRNQLPDPRPHPRTNRQPDLEESQILEDIFFIC